VVELGGLWPGYVSQAHHGITPPGYGHPFLCDPAQLTKGHIYSYVMVNNFRTAFQVAQVADLLFRYSVTSYEGDWRAGGASDLGWSVATPLEAVCVTGPQTGSLPESDSFCRLDKPNVRLLAMKGAEDGDGLILRLVETEGQDTSVTVELPCMQIDEAFSTNLVEENQGVLAYDRHCVRVLVQANSIVTLRCLGSSNWPQATWFSRFHG
jgi:alpha-mannosidase